MHVIKRKKNIRSKFFTTIKKKASTQSSSCIKPETRTSNSHFKHCQVALVVPMQESQVGSLDWEDPLEKRMATHSSILA